MDHKFNEDELEPTIQRVRQLLEIQHQALPPLSPMWECWLEKALPCIAHAGLVDAIWPTRFWWSVLRFCVAKPLVTKRIVHGLFNMYFNVEWTADAARQYVDALLVVSGYAASHLLHQTINFLFLSGQYLLSFAWTNSLWVCTACGVLVGLMILMRVQGVKITSIGWRIINQALSLGYVMVILHFRFSVFCRKLWASIKRSSGIRICKHCLRYSILRVLGRPTFDELQTFEYPPLPPE